MNYFMDTEFHEYKKKKIDTIELISIGIVAEDDREYYAICNEFDIKAAWNSFQMKETGLPMQPIKEYWLRENVLRAIWDELHIIYLKGRIRTFCLKDFKYLIKKYGKSKEQIAEEIIMFTKGEIEGKNGILIHPDRPKILGNPEFYAYYADYDWVVFCWLFGRMIDLPKGFPMYCRDLKQMLDEKVGELTFTKHVSPTNSKLWKGKENIEIALKLIKGESINKDLGYPLQRNEHNALDDAKWNQKLFKFIQTI